MVSFVRMTESTSYLSNLSAKTKKSLRGFFQNNFLLQLDSQSPIVSSTSNQNLIKSININWSSSSSSSSFGFCNRSWGGDLNAEATPNLLHDGPSSAVINNSGIVLLNYPLFDIVQPGFASALSPTSTINGDGLAQAVVL